MILQFDDYQIDTKEYSLSLSGQLLDVEPTVFKIIAYLIENRSKIATRDELFSKIWSDKCVSDSALSNHIKNARKILGDNGNRQLMIKTIHRRGYQFICETTELTSHVISVLPLSNAKPCSKTDYYGIAISQQIVAELSRTSALTICPLSQSYCSNQSLKELTKGVNSEKADYVLTGNYIEQNGLIRLNVELVDLKNSSICWLESIELESTSIFILQDLVASMATKGVVRKLNIKSPSNLSPINQSRGSDFQQNRARQVNKKPYLQLL